jgi:hypothetical protein
MTRDLRVITGIGILYLYSIIHNAKLQELYISGYDQTLVINNKNQNVTRILGEGRLTGFRLAPNGNWAIEVNVYNDKIFIFDLLKRTEDFIPLDGSLRAGEFSRVPIEVSYDSKLAIVSNIPVNQIL